MFIVKEFVEIMMQLIVVFHLVEGIALKFSHSLAKTTGETCPNLAGRFGSIIQLVGWFVLLQYHWGHSRWTLVKTNSSSTTEMLSDLCFQDPGSLWVALGMAFSTHHCRVRKCNSSRRSMSWYSRSTYRLMFYSCCTEYSSFYISHRLEDLHFFFEALTHRAQSDKKSPLNSYFHSWNVCKFESCKGYLVIDFWVRAAWTSEEAWLVPVAYWRSLLPKALITLIIICFNYYIRK